MKRGASGGHELVPIDHGYVLPDSFQDISFEWLYWPQARAPLGEYLRSSMVRKGCMHCNRSELLWPIRRVLTVMESTLRLPCQRSC